jgi:hypothetical protein
VPTARPPALSCSPADLAKLDAADRCRLAIDKRRSSASLIASAGNGAYAGDRPKVLLLHEIGGGLTDAEASETLSTHSHENAIQLEPVERYMNLPIFATRSRSDR